MNPLVLFPGQGKRVNFLIGYHLSLCERWRAIITFTLVSLSYVLSAEERMLWMEQFPKNTSDWFDWRTESREVEEQLARGKLRHRELRHPSYGTGTVIRLFETPFTSTSHFYSHLLICPFNYEGVAAVSTPRIHNSLRGNRYRIPNQRKIFLFFLPSCRPAGKWDAKQEDSITSFQWLSKRTKRYGSLFRDFPQWKRRDTAFGVSLFKGWEQKTVLRISIRG